MVYELATLINNIVLSIFTIVLAVYTIFLWSEAKKSREYQIKLNRPELSVIFEPSKKYIQWININIKNIGKSSLYNLSLERVDGNDICCFNGKKISEVEYLKNINYLRPEQEIVQFFYNFVNSQLKPEDIKFNLFFKYFDDKGNEYKKKFIFNFGQFMDMSQLGEEPIYKIADSIKKMQEDFGHLSSGFHKLSVITQTKKEKLKEEHRQLDIIKNKQMQIKNQQTNNDLPKS